MKRRSDWAEALVAFTLQQQSRPFEWGKNDCGTAVFDWIELCTGERLWNATYSDAIGGARYMAEHGGLLAIMTGILGPPMPITAAARRGDVGLVKDPEGRETLAVVIGARCAGPGPDGMVQCDRAWLTAAWSI